MLKCENLSRTNSTKSETQFFWAKIQENEHTLEGYLGWRKTLLVKTDEYRPEEMLHLNDQVFRVKYFVHI